MSKEQCGADECGGLECQRSTVWSRRRLECQRNTSWHIKRYGRKTFGTLPEIWGQPCILVFALVTAFPFSEVTLSVSLSSFHPPPLKSYCIISFKTPCSISLSFSLQVFSISAPSQHAPYLSFVLSQPSQMSKHRDCLHSVENHIECYCFHLILLLSSCL